MRELFDANVGFLHARAQYTESARNQTTTADFAHEDIVVGNPS
jgi:hypothetical protein